MKQKILILLALFLPLFLFSQDRVSGEKGEKLEMLKRTFISERLQLTVSEAEKFWPLFNEMETKRKEIRKQINEQEKKLEFGGVSDKMLNEVVEIISAKRKEEADVEREFIKSSIPILGAEKAARLVGLEDEFKKKLMDELRERRSQDSPTPRGRR